MFLLPALAVSLCAAPLPVRLEPEPEITVRGEKVRLPPGKITPLAGGVQPGRNRMIDALGTPRSAPGSLKPGSLRLRFEGRELQEGKDYVADEFYCRIGAGANPSFPPNAELELDYVYRLRRIDSLVRTSSGEETLIRGVPHINIPQPPPLPAGAVRLANYFLDYDTPPDAPLEFRITDVPVVTATTRKPRVNEVDGVDYFFVSLQEFEHMIAMDQLLEYAVVYNQYKGIPKEQIRKAFESGRDVILRVDVQGAARLRSLYPEAALIFLIPSSQEE